MEVKGKVIQNLGIQSGTSKAGKPWSKASILIETEGQYPKKIALDNLKNADEFSKLSIGSFGTFHVEINSNEYNGRWYTSVNCWKWVIDEPQFSPAPQSAIPQSGTPILDSMGVQGYQNPQSAMKPAEADDLPF